MTPIEWMAYRQLLNKVYDAFGGAVALAAFLKRDPDYLYKWRSPSNYKSSTQTLKRKMSLKEAKKISEKLDWVTIQELRPDVGKYFEKES